MVNIYYTISLIFFMSHYSLLFSIIIVENNKDESSIQRKYRSPFLLLYPGYDHNLIKINKFLDSQKHSYVVFIEDHEGNHYIVKQDRSSTLKHQFQVVLEKLSAYIAAALNISAQKVEILPAEICFPGKLIAERPASIHTVMPGVTLWELKKGSPYYKISLKQGSNPERPSDGFGLNEAVIASMSQHSDLPPIAALDTFTANRDRNKANLLYDETTNRFYAIDMALVYDITNPNRLFIPEIACQNIQKMITQKVIFNKKELKALKKYHDVLQDLLKIFPPQRIYSLLCEFINEAGLHEKNFPYIRFHGFVKNYEIAIYKTHETCTRLSMLLSDLLALQSSNN